MKGAKTNEKDIITGDLSSELFDTMVARLPLIADLALAEQNKKFCIDQGIDVRVSFDIGAVRDLDFVPL